MAVRGERILQLAPKDNSKWKGPWDCAEFASWLVFQAAGMLYGCASDSADPASSDAYTGYWARDAETLGVKIPVEQAIRTPGAAVLRSPQSGATGHIVISDGRGYRVDDLRAAMGYRHPRPRDRVLRAGCGRRDESTESRHLSADGAAYD